MKTFEFLKFRILEILNFHPWDMVSAHLCRNVQTSEPSLLDNALNPKLFPMLPRNARKMAIRVPHLPRAKFDLSEEGRCHSVVVCLT